MLTLISILEFCIQISHQTLENSLQLDYTYQECIQIFTVCQDLASLDLISTRYAPMRQSLLSLYQALNFQPFRRSEPSLQALAYVSTLAKQYRRVTAKEQNVALVFL